MVILNAVADSKSADLDPAWIQCKDCANSRFSDFTVSD